MDFKICQWHFTYRYGYTVAYKRIKNSIAQNVEQIARLFAFGSKPAAVVNVMQLNILFFSHRVILFSTVGGAGCYRVLASFVELSSYY